MDNSAKIRRVSLALQYLCYLFLALAAGVVLMMIYHMLFRPDLLQQYVLREFVSMYVAATEANFLVGAITIFLLMAPAPLLMYALWRLSQLFALLRRNLYFTEEAAQNLYAFAWAWILFHLLPWPMVLLADTLLSEGSEWVGRGIQIQITGEEIPSLIASISFLVVAWILRESVKIANENAEFV